MRHVLLLAGGQGKRFWPRSRRQRPKQFISFDGRASLLRATAERLAPLVPFERQWVITNRDYIPHVARVLPELDPRHILGEPRGLNTGPAVGLAAIRMQAEDPSAHMVVQAADHWIRDTRRFRALVAAAFARAESGGGAVLVGFRPTRAATGYGYIGLGRKLASPRGMRFFEVGSYKEKPTAATARRYLESGRYLWNGCLFFWSAATILEGIDHHLPELGRNLRAAASRSATGADRAIDWLYRRASPVSIEHGVVEKLAGKTVLEGDCGWEDVGTWESLRGLLPRDGAGNAVQGRHLGIDTQGSLVLSDSGLVVTLGVRDLIVVKDGDAVLVLPRSRDGRMREVVEALERDPRLADFL